MTNVSGPRGRIPGQGPQLGNVFSGTKSSEETGPRIKKAIEAPAGKISPDELEKLETIGKVGEDNIDKMSSQEREAGSIFDEAFPPDSDKIDDALDELDALVAEHDQSRAEDTFKTPEKEPSGLQLAKEILGDDADKDLKDAEIENILNELFGDQADQPDVVMSKGLEYATKVLSDLEDDILFNELIETLADQPAPLSEEARASFQLIKDAVSNLRQAGNDVQIDNQGITVSGEEGGSTTIPLTEDRDTIMAKLNEMLPEGLKVPLPGPPDFEPSPASERASSAATGVLIKEPVDRPTTRNDQKKVDKGFKIWKFLGGKVPKSAARFIAKIAFSEMPKLEDIPDTHHRYLPASMLSQLDAKNFSNEQLRLLSDRQRRAIQSKLTQEQINRFRSEGGKIEGG